MMPAFSVVPMIAANTRSYNLFLFLQFVLLLLLLVFLDCTSS